MGINGKDHRHAPCQRRATQIRSYPVVERHGFVGVAGATRRQPTRPRSTPFWGRQPGWAYGGGLYHIACDYRLMVDKPDGPDARDHMHSTSIGQKGDRQAPVATRTEGDAVITSRFMENVMPPPFWRLALRGNRLADNVPVDRWQICRFHALRTS